MHLYESIKEPSLSPQKTTTNNKTQKIINNIIKITFVPQDKKDLNRKRTFRHKLSGIYIYIYIDNSTFFLVFVIVDSINISRKNNTYRNFIISIEFFVIYVYIIINK